MNPATQQRSPAQLLALAADALAQANARLGPTPQSDVCWTLGSLRAVFSALDSTLQTVGHALTEQAAAGALRVVEGPFAEEPEAATDTARMWLERARLLLAAGPVRAVDNAHIAASGLALPEGRR